MKEAEIWQSDYEHLRKEMDAAITKRKIRKISFKHNGQVMVAEVGKPSPYEGQSVIRAIYEDGKRGAFLLCGGTVTMAGKDSLVEEY